MSSGGTRVSIWEMSETWPTVSVWTAGAGWPTCGARVLADRMWSRQQAVLVGVAGLDQGAERPGTGLVAAGRRLT